MSKNINRAVNLTSYFISLPPAIHLLTAIICVGLAFGFLINLGKAKEIPNAAIDGLMLLTLPALISSLVVKLMLRKMPLNRIAATALGGQIVYALAYGISLVLAGAGFDPFWVQSVILIGSAIVFVFWYVIARFVFILKYRSILFAMIQLLLYLIFFMSNQALYTTSEPFIGLAARFFISAFVLLGALALFFMIINAPMKTNLGLSSTDAMSYLFSAWLYHNKEMEKAFEQVGEDAKTVLSVMGFRRRDGTIFFVTPCVHFGPFGNLGGSEFSYLLADAIDRKHGSRTFVFHGTVTHDLNPVATAEMSKILAAFDASLEAAAYKDAKVSVSTGKSAECRAEALRINDSAMIGLTRAPETTEDVNFGLGLALMAEAEKHAATAMVVDQHNAETGDITSFEPGSMTGFGYMSAITDALTKQDAQKKPLKLGVASRSVDSDVLGKAGIKVAVFSSSPEYVVVLIDSNGVTPKFRSRIEAEVKKLGKGMGRDFMVGVFTTDTHQTNMVRGVLNPLKEEENIMDAILKACSEAVDDMQEAKFFADKRWFDIRVIGARQSIEVISTINSIVAVSKITLPLVLLGGLLLLIAIATRI
jgi:putative membrane protein